MSIGRNERRPKLQKQPVNTDNLFCQLPLELLLHIIRDCSNATLHQLALTCSRFHQILPQILLQRHRISERGHEATITVHEFDVDAFTCTGVGDGLSALQIAFPTSAMNHLSCTFDFKCINGVQALTYDVYRLRKFISGLTQLDRLTLSFTRTCCCHAVFADDLKAWATALGALLNTVLQKGCAQLEVHGAEFMLHSFKTVANSNLTMVRVRQTLNAVRAVLCVDMKARPIDITKTLEYRFEPFGDHTLGNHIVDFKLLTKSPKLRSLELTSATLLIPPVLRWTMSCLRTCPVEELTLKGITLSWEGWSVVYYFLLTSMPLSLKKLTLRKLDNTPVLAFFDFLASIPRLETLEIADNVVTPHGAPQRRNQSTYANLVTLSAPCFVVERLLRESHLPQLRHLNISYYMGTETDSTSMMDSLDCVLRAMDQPEHEAVDITLKIIVGHCNEPMRLGHISYFSKHYHRVSHLVVVFADSGLEQDLPNLLPRDDPDMDHTALNLKTIDLFQNISSLFVSSGSPYSKTEWMEYLAACKHADHFPELDLDNVTFDKQ